MNEKNNSHVEFSNIDCSNDFIFLCDITQHFNESNKKLKNKIKLVMFENIKIFMRKMQITEFMWLGIHDLEIKLVEFQSSIPWKNKFEKLVSEVEGEVSDSSAENNEPTLKILY